MATRVVVEDLGRVANSVKVASRAYRDIAQVYTALETPLLGQLFQLLSESLAKLQLNYQQMQTMLHNNFYSFFKYHQMEMESLKELTATVEAAKGVRFARDTHLLDKKLRLFAQKQLSKWNLEGLQPGEEQTLLHDKTTAVRKMLPQESREAYHFAVVDCFYTHRLHEEFAHLNNRSLDVMARHFALVAGSCNEFTQEVVFSFIF
jgi:hypothetical protein